MSTPLKDSIIAKAPEDRTAAEQLFLDYYTEVDNIKAGIITSEASLHHTKLVIQWYVSVATFTTDMGDEITNYIDA